MAIVGIALQFLWKDQDEFKLNVVLESKLLDSRRYIHVSLC